MSMNLSRRVRFEPALDYAAGTATRIGKTIDTRGYDALAIVLTLGTVAVGATGFVHLQGGKLADGSDMANLESTSLPILDSEDSNSIKIIDMGHSRYRYVRLVVTKDGANASEESAVAQLYNSGSEPVQQSTWTEAKHVHAPDQGVA